MAPVRADLRVDLPRDRIGVFVECRPKSDRVMLEALVRRHFRKFGGIFNANMRTINTVNSVLKGAVTPIRVKSSGAKIPDKRIQIGQMNT